jgi:hypothetical protein
MIETGYPQRRSAYTRGRISEVLAAIALALALILVIDTSTSHGGTGFLGMSQEQTGGKPGNSVNDGNLSACTD